MVSVENPAPLADDWPSDVRSLIAVLRPKVAALGSCPIYDRKKDETARESGRLPIIRRVVSEHVAALFGDDIEDSALDIAKFRGRADRLDLHFLDDVDPRFGDGAACTRTREAGAIEQEIVLVDIGAKRRHGAAWAERRHRT